jgi:hypothetical protein
MREVVREQVTVDRPDAVAWDHLAALEQWPTWAGHIRRMDPTPPGALTASTSVVLSMRRGPRTTMKVTEYEPPRRWVWEGRSFGTVTRFEHQFERLGDASTRIWFLAWMGGPLAPLGGWWFGRMMKRHLSIALPKLKAEIEERTG